MTAKPLEKPIELGAAKVQFIPTFTSFLNDLRGRFSMLLKGLIFSFFLISFTGYAQFTNGMRQGFGKNRVQHEEFFWFYHKFDRFTIYEYKGGEKLAEYTAIHAMKNLKDIEKRLGYATQQHINFIIYNKQNEFEQSNIDFDDNESGTGGVTEIASSNVFLYFEGDYNKFNKQIRTGLSEMLVNRMMFGENWKEVIKNSTLLSVPDWYTKGLISYVTNPWTEEIDNRVKDGIMTNRYKRFNHLEEPDKTYAGHAIWNYIAEVYGPEQIPNVLYMARVSRSIESGFLFVLGVNLLQLTKDTWLHYRVNYDMDDENSGFPPHKEAFSKTKRKRKYFEVKRSPTGENVAYSTNKLGKFKSVLYDVEKGKKKTLIKGGIKQDRLPDYSYPLMAWHPEGKIVAIYYEKKAEPSLILYDLEENKKYKREVFKVDKILDMKYSPSGNKMIMSAMLQGQTDIWEYNLQANTINKITDDIYDDLEPAYLDKSGKIVFTSNRPNTEIPKGKELNYDHQPKKDLFTFNPKSDKMVQLTQTEFDNERFPYFYKPNEYVYLSDGNGISNRWIARLDSVVSHVDTLIHYRYVTKTSPLTNYSRSILEHQLIPDEDKSIDLVFYDGKYRLYKLGIEELEKQSEEDMKSTAFKAIENESDWPEKTAPKEVEVVLSSRVVEELSPEIPEDEEVNIDDYTFTGEKRQSEKRGKEGQFKEVASRPDGKKGEVSESEKLIMPQKRTYNTNFSYTNLVTTMDFNFANQLYQPFNGGPYVNPGMGILGKVSMLDLFQDYKIEGGFRYGFNNNNLELFASLYDRSARWDKRYTVKRQGLKYTSDVAVTKVIIYKGEYELTYPITEVLAWKTELSYRHDRTVAAAIDDVSLLTPDVNVGQAGVKVELVFDNTRKRGLNLYYGTRFKIFGERYQLVDDLNSDLNVVGLDFRHYQKIHRDLIWASRLAASTSVGQRKLVYYLGSVDDWIILNPDNQRFNSQTPIAQDQNYSFQALASPMRGFIQNARNGNSFAVINNELRFPVFKYFSRKPLKSDFTTNFQIVAFGDVGTAWNGKTPFSEDNEFNTLTVVDGPVTVRLDNKRYPIIGGYGAGLRTKLMGYFLKLDLAYGVEDGIIQKPVTHLSMGFDF
ncbi:MAG: hypothetical protein KDC83_02480 [Flavobacteriales bacterium]|nr:hypothetical protein [Flavobacteriales bacterium]